MQTTLQNLKRIFTTRLDTLSHIVDIGERHFGDEQTLLQARLAPDMFPFGTQIAFACNQPRGFSQWCAGENVQNLGPEVTTLAQAREYIANTRKRVDAVTADDRQLDLIKRVGLGSGMYCELPGHRYVDDYLIPNLYFHITAAYAILRNAGAPIGKADFMIVLAPDVRKEGA